MRLAYSAEAQAEANARSVARAWRIAEREGLEVTQEDITGELAQIAQRNQASIDEVLNYYRENRLLDQVAVELIERKVRKFIRENANVQTGNEANGNDGNIGISVVILSIE